MTHLTPRYARRTWRRLRHRHRDALNSVLIGALFVVVGLMAARFLLA